MKKIIIFLIIIGLIITGYFVFKNKKQSNLKSIKVAEVTHSIFYTPQYVAHALGYFKDEGLDVNFLLTPGADKVTSAVLSGDVEIGFCGSESTIYVYNGGEKDYLQSFAGLTKKDGSFLISRKKEKFDLNKLKGKHIIAGREGGMPAMTLEYALNKNGIKTNELNFDTSIDFASTSGAFIGGTGDYVSLFEPTASELEKKGYGYIVASVGKLGGNVPYTSYIARKSYIKNNEKTIKDFAKGIQKGLDYVYKHKNDEIAEIIKDYFPDTNVKKIEQIIKRYKDIDAWNKETKISKKDFDHIKEIVKNAGKLDKDVPYTKLVYTK
ncbi:MAG: ABC transporter substrate-binding protein [Bacilli bacterium]|nr:ABC transporter substrate-binding protein [Bacilli bacterium]